MKISSKVKIEIIEVENGWIFISDSSTDVYENGSDMLVAIDSYLDINSIDFINGNFKDSGPKD